LDQSESHPYGDGSKPWYLVNPKIAGKWMFIPLKMVLIGIDPYPYIFGSKSPPVPFGPVPFGHKGPELLGCFHTAKAHQ